MESLSKVWSFIKSIRTVRREVVGLAIMSVIPLSICLDAYIQNHQPIEVVNHAEASEVPEVVMIEEKINWTPERIEREIREVFPEKADTMVAIAKCESGLIARAVGPTNDHGIFQIHVPSHKRFLEGVDLNDPRENIKFARFLYDNGGLSHWRASAGCWKHGK